MVTHKYRSKPVRIEKPSGLKYFVWQCSERGFCTEADRGRKMQDGSPMPVCASCPLLEQCRVEQPVFNSGIGTRLKRIIEKNVGAVPCGECKKEIRRLNEMTVAEVLADRDSLADRIVERAQSKAKKWWQRWGATLAPGFAKARVLGWIDEAVATENQPVTVALELVQGPGQTDAPDVLDAGLIPDREQEPPQ